MTTSTIAEILKCANLQMVAVLMSAYPKPDRQHHALRWSVKYLWHPA